MPPRLQVARAISSLVQALDTGVNVQRGRNFHLGEFKNRAWATFNPSYAMECLSDPAPTFPGHKQALFYALCSWVIAPKNTKLIKAAIAQSALTSIHQAEASALNECEKVAEADVLARFGYLGSDFLREIYFPIGGARAFMTLMTATDFRSAQNKAYVELQYSVKILEIAHFHLVELNSRSKYGSPSLNKSSELLKELRFFIDPDLIAPSKRSVTAYWANNRRSIALAYAAKSINLDSGKNYLEEMVNSKVSYVRGIE